VLFLLFRLGADRYALDTAGVAEVLPLVNLTQIPQAPAGVAGMFNYHGAPVPAVDLSALTMGRPAERRISTRIILVHYPDSTGRSRLLGLIAERATETSRREPTDFVESGIANDGAPYLGPVASDADGLLQWIQLDGLLPASVREGLFPARAAL
jgi:chemotaxis-related protein WspB